MAIDFSCIKIKLPGSSSNFSTIPVKDNMVCIRGETSQDAIRSSFRERMNLDGIVRYCSNQSSILQMKQINSGIRGLKKNILVQGTESQFFPYIILSSSTRPSGFKKEQQLGNVLPATFLPLPSLPPPPQKKT